MNLGELYDNCEERRCPLLGSLLCLVYADRFGGQARLAETY
jgi:hypothetical protein